MIKTYKNLTKETSLTLTFITLAIVTTNKYLGLIEKFHQFKLPRHRDNGRNIYTHQQTIRYSVYIYKFIKISKSVYG